MNKQRALFVVAQKAAIAKAGKFLILKRSLADADHPGLWDFPGGKIRSGEEPGKALEREVFEETGLKAKAGQPVFAFAEKMATPVLFLVWKTSLLKKSLKRIILSSEHTEFRWASAAEAKRLKCEPFLKAFIKQAR